jgi:putative redox protein
LPATAPSAGFTQRPAARHCGSIRRAGFLPAFAESFVLYLFACGLRKLSGGTGGAARNGPVRGAKNSMRANVRWSGPDEMSFIAETGSGHLVAMDVAPDGGGRNLAPRPMEMVLVGTGGCTAYDVVLILKRGRHQVTGCEVRLDAERAATDPKVFTRIGFHFVVRGRGLPRDAVERAVRLSHEKYCSATAMLARTAEIVTTVEVLEAG